jgi:hypothetical protein
MLIFKTKVIIAAGRRDFKRTVVPPDNHRTVFADHHFLRLICRTGFAFEPLFIARNPNNRLPDGQMKIPSDDYGNG